MFTSTLLLLLRCPEPPPHCVLFYRHKLYFHLFIWHNSVMKDDRKGSTQAFKDVTDFPPEKMLQVNNCGTKQNYGPNYTLLRPRGRKDYYLLYVAKGWVGVELNGELVRLQKGHCAMFLPGTPQMLLFEKGGNPTIFYAHFTGPMADETIAAMELSPVTLCAIDSHTMFEVLFNQMVQAFLPLKLLKGRHPICVPKVNGLLLQLLDLLAQSIEQRVRTEQDAITPAMLYISEHFHEEVDLEKCAAISHLSVSRFSHLFTQKLGISPYKFLLSLRMDEAKELLLYSSMSVREVCESVGFSDPSYFSRMFRKYTGYSPSEYRDRA